MPILPESQDRDDTVLLLAAIVESSDDAIVGKDLNGVVTSWNTAAERILGYTATEMVGRSIRTIIPAERQSEEDLILSQVRAGIRVDHFETWRLHKDGHLVPLSLTVSPIKDSTGRVVGASKIARDVTERLAAQEKLARHAEAMTLAVAEARMELEKSNEALRRGERLASLGTMAAGLGHDIGNLLLPMRSSIDFLRAAYPDDDSVAENCGVLARCADYFASLVRGLRLFGRGDSDDRAGDTSDLARWSEDARGLLSNLVGRGVTIDVQIDDGLPGIGLGPGALTQAAVNLVKNSIDAFAAVPAGSAGSKLRADARVVVRAYAGDRDGQGNVANVIFEVSDNGPGMRREVMQHCMEPYFTTRVRGYQAGTGLGLSLVYRLVHEVGGSTEVLSELGQGTTVRLRIPVARKRVIESVGAAPVADVRIENTGTRALVTAILRAAGFDLRWQGELHAGASLWVTDTLSDDEIVQRESAAVILATDRPLTRAQEEAGCCRVSSRPLATELMRCLDSCAVVRRAEASAG